MVRLVRIPVSTLLLTSPFAEISCSVVWVVMNLKSMYEVALPCFISLIAIHDSARHEITSEKITISGNVISERYKKFKQQIE